MANKPFVYSNMKKCSPALIIREVQIQTTMRYQLKLMSMATIHIHAHTHTHTHTHVRLRDSTGSVSDRHSKASHANFLVSQCI